VRSVEGTIVGVILNEFDIQGRSNHYYKYYGYGEGLKEAEPAV
jgi:hypothetical protein